MQEFARFYEGHRAAITARTRELVADSPIWARIIQQLGGEQGARADDASHQLMMQAIFEGRWEPYLASMRAQGEQFASVGATYAAWFEVIRAYRNCVTDLLAAGGESPERNVQNALAISRGMAILLDLVIEQVGEAYLEAKQREAARSEELYRSMFEQSPLPMWTFDRNSLRFLTVNEAAVRHYGYTREEFAAMTLADIRPAEDVEALHADVANAPPVGDRGTWRHHKKDGTTILVEICGRDFTLDGKLVRLVLVNDITERVRAEQALRAMERQLRHAQKMEVIGRLADGVAHDFNNVLTVVQTHACMLEDGTELSEAQREDVAAIRRAAERGSGITRQLLAISRQREAEPRPVDVPALIKGFIPMLRRLVGESVSITAQHASVPEVIADPGQIEQVLMHLVLKAKDAMPDSGRLTIECRAVELDLDTARLYQLEPGPFVEIAVTDTGSGVDAEAQEGEAKGFGLAVVQGIVKQAGGRVTVYSERGHGTTVRVQLPASRKPVTGRVPRYLEIPATLPPLRILVVDDDSEVRAAAARILRDAGCFVIEAGSAAEARKTCIRHEDPIDLVLLDVMLSDGRGDVLAHELRELRRAMAVVLMSGYSASAVSGSGSAAEHVLLKPFSPAELRAAIARACPASTAEVKDDGTRDGAHYRALVADDDDGLRRVLARILTKADFEVVDVDNGQQAIDALASGSFDVIVTDVRMPEGGGLDLLRAVRRIDLDVPVILMTGEPSVEAAAAAVEYGAFRYLTKPLDNPAFVRIAKQAARAHALARIRREAYSVTGAHAGVGDRAGLEVRFEQALDGMWMAFQPIVHASSGALFGVEALMRTSEPSIPNPGAMLDAATQLGRVSLVGRKVRSLASAALAPRPDKIALFVNLHPEDLHDVDLIDDTSPLAQIASQVVLEVTERTSLESSPKLSERLARLRQLGFRLAVDDIGAGYSGLTSFTELMPEVVKIDMSLVRDVHKSALKQRTIAALCRLCHDIGTLVVGEGVETHEERDVLVELGCDLLQGYLIGRPQRELP